MSENKSQTPAQNTPENSEKKKVSLFALIVVLVVAVIVMVALFVRSNNLSSQLDEVNGQLAASDGVHLLGNQLTQLLGSGAHAGGVSAAQDHGVQAGVVRTGASSGGAGSRGAGIGGGAGGGGAGVAAAAGGQAQSHGASQDKSCKFLHVCFLLLNGMFYLFTCPTGQGPTRSRVNRSQWSAAQQRQTDRLHISDESQGQQEGDDEGDRPLGHSHGRLLRQVSGHEQVQAEGRRGQADGQTAH